MSEFPSSTELAWQALETANTTHDKIRNIETELKQARLSENVDSNVLNILTTERDRTKTEFLLLQDIAERVYGRKANNEIEPPPEFSDAIDDTRPVAMRVIAEVITHRSNIVLREQMRDRALRLFGDLAGVRVEVEVSVLKPKVEAEIEKPPLDEPIEKRLRAELGSLYKTKGSRLAGVLTREGVCTTRDALVVGEEEIADIRNIARSSIEILHRAIKSVDPTLVLLAKPTIIDIAQLCDDTSQVPARVLHHCFCRGAYMSIEKLTSSTVEEIMQLVNDAQSTHMYVDETYAYSLIEKAKKFSEEFWATKAAMAQTTNGEM